MLKIYLNHEDAKIPTRGSTGAAGYDLYSIEDKVIKPFSSEKFRTGIQIEIPNGLYGKIHPRSSLDIKYGIHPLAGIIDDDFTGEVIVALYNKNTKKYQVNKGDRIAQIVFQKYEVLEIKEVNNVKDLTLTERGISGFGSTGK